MHQVEHHHLPGIQQSGGGSGGEGLHGAGFCTGPLRIGQSQFTCHLGKKIGSQHVVLQSVQHAEQLPRRQVLGLKQQARPTLGLQGRRGHLQHRQHPLDQFEAAIGAAPIRGHGFGASGLAAVSGLVRRGIVFLAQVVRSPQTRRVQFVKQQLVQAGDDVLHLVVGHTGRSVVRQTGVVEPGFARQGLWPILKRRVVRLHPAKVERHRVAAGAAHSGRFFVEKYLKLGLTKQAGLAFVQLLLQRWHLLNRHGPTARRQRRPPRHRWRFFGHSHAANTGSWRCPGGQRWYAGATRRCGHRWRLAQHLQAADVQRLEAGGILTVVAAQHPVALLVFQVGLGFGGQSAQHGFVHHPQVGIDLGKTGGFANDGFHLVAGGAAILPRRCNRGRWCLGQCMCHAPQGGQRQQGFFEHGLHQHAHPSNTNGLLLH